MKRTHPHAIAAFAAAMSLGAFAESAAPAADYEAGERSDALVTPQVGLVAGQMLGGEAASNLLHAIRLNLELYDLEMRSEAGRARWHGRRVGERAFTNEQVKVTTYSNEQSGAVWRYKEPFVQKPPRRHAPAALSTNGVPERLAEAIARRNAQRAGIESNVTVEVVGNLPEE